MTKPVVISSHFGFFLGLETSYDQGYGIMCIINNKTPRITKGESVFYILDHEKNTWFERDMIEIVDHKSQRIFTIDRYILKPPPSDNEGHLLRAADKLFSKYANTASQDLSRILLKICDYFHSSDKETYTKGRSFSTKLKPYPDKVQFGSLQINPYPDYQTIQNIDTRAINLSETENDMAKPIAYESNTKEDMEVDDINTKFRKKMGKQDIIPFHY